MPREMLDEPRMTILDQSLSHFSQLFIGKSFQFLQHVFFAAQKLNIKPQLLQNLRDFQRFLRRRLLHHLAHTRLFREWIVLCHNSSHLTISADERRRPTDKLLGQGSIQNTLVYTQLVEFKDDEYTSKIAQTAKEASQLVESGFEHVCTTPENLMLFKKRKRPL